MLTHAFTAIGLEDAEMALAIAAIGGSSVI